MLAHYAHVLENFCQRHSTETGLLVQLLLRKLTSAQKVGLNNVIL